MPKMTDCAPSSPSKSEQDWRAESDHRTLTDAAEIHSDHGRMKGVAKHHKTMTRRMSKVGSMIAGKR